MRRFVISAAALVGLVATASSASAQPYRNHNKIYNSGNGANNTIVARNAPIQLHAPGFAPDYQAGYAPPMYQGGYAPPVYQGGFAPAPVFGGVNRNVISNSGNGIGNTIIAQNGGFGFGGSFPGGGVFPGGVNVNVVTNSGNGVGNRVIAGNSGAPGGLNLNIITNSGNGVGNTIVTRNR